MSKRTPRYPVCQAKHPPGQAGGNCPDCRAMLRRAVAACLGANHGRRPKAVPPVEVEARIALYSPAAVARKPIPYVRAS